MVQAGGKPPRGGGPQRLLLVGTGILLLLAAISRQPTQAACPPSSPAATATAVTGGGSNRLDGSRRDNPSLVAGSLALEEEVGAAGGNSSSSDDSSIGSSNGGSNDGSGSDSSGSGDGSGGIDADFDHVAYLDNYPQLLQHPTSLKFSREAAWHHYRSVGKAEGRVARRIPLRLRYHTGGQNKPGGLNNQLLCHLTAMMLALEMGAEVVLAPALKRTAFAAEGNAWIWEDTATLLDVDQMVAFWKAHGLVIHESPRLSEDEKAEYPLLVERDEPPTAVYGDRGCLTIDLPRPHKFDNNLATIAKRARARAVKAAEQALLTNGALPECINLDTPRIFYRIPVVNSLNLAVTIFSDGFFFNQEMLKLAEHIKRAMGWPFHGAHMRIENDASVWNGADGEERVLQEYLKVMAAANFTKDSTVYVASGLLFDGPSPEFDAMVAVMKKAGVAGKVDYKERLVDKAVLAGLHSEQLALVDLLVLAASKAFVGHPWSTLSMLVEQLRICEGRGMATTHYVTVLDEVKEGMNLKMKDKFVRFAKGFTPPR